MRSLKYDNNKRLIKLTVSTLRRFQSFSEKDGDSRIECFYDSKAF